MRTFFLSTFLAVIQFVVYGQQHSLPIYYFVKSGSATMYSDTVFTATNGFCAEAGEDIIFADSAIVHNGKKALIIDAYKNVNVTRNDKLRDNNRDTFRAVGHTWQTGHPSYSGDHIRLQYEK